MASFGLGDLVGQCFALLWYAGLNFPHGVGGVVAELIPIIAVITDEVGDFPKSFVCDGMCGWFEEGRVVV